MNPKQETYLLLALCLFMMLLSLAGLVWAFVAGLLWPQVDMDGLLLALVCLTLAGVFKLLFFHIARTAGIFDVMALLRRKKKAEAPGAAEKKPAGSGSASGEKGGEPSSGS